MGLPDIKRSLELALHELPIPVVIHCDDVIQFANHAAHELMGYGREEYGAGVGMNIMAFQPPELADRIHRQRDTLLASGEPVLNLPMVTVDRQKRRSLCLASGKPVLWGGRPAILVSFMVLGQADGETGADGVEGLRALASMSTRERAIALMVCQGYGTENIAAILELSAHTVRTHLRNIYKKTGTHSRLELMQAMTGMQTPPMVARERSGGG